MAFPETIKSRGSIRQGELKTTTYILTQDGQGGYNSAPGTSRVRYTPTACLGDRSVFQGNTSHQKFIPNQLKVNPVIHYGNVATCSTAEARLPMKLGNNFPIILSVAGEVAAFVQNFANLDSYIAPSFSGWEDPFFRACADSKRPAAELAVTLAELPETLGMLRDGLDKLHGQVGKLKPPGGLKNPLSALNYAMNAWLTARYGILPACQEVDTYRKIVGQKLSGTFPLSKSAASGTSNGWLIHPNQFVRSVPGGYAFGTEQCYRNDSVYARCYTQKTLSGQQALGMDLSSVPSAIWELIPYSFVVDWFFDVGGWISNTVPHPGVSLLSAHTSAKAEIKYECSVSRMCLNPSSSEVYPEVDCKSSFLFLQSAYQRQGPSVPATIPLLQWGLTSWQRQVDAISLLAQRIPQGLPRIPRGMRKPKIPAVIYPHGGIL